MKKYLSLVTFTHTIFAMPFAFIGFFLAVSTTNHPFEWPKLVMMVLCMIFARNSAMAFNRYLDRDIDSKNPRTKQRDIPSGRISPAAALTFTIINCLLFIATTWFINELCFFLSPVALLVVLGYSATKRFTALCHLVLGLGLSLAPIGAYLAVTGEFNIIPLFFSLFLPFAYSIKTLRNRYLSGFFNHISKISYSMYLVHYSLVYILFFYKMEQVSRSSTIAFYILYWMIVIVLSSLLYKYFEKPVMNLRNRTTIKEQI